MQNSLGYVKKFILSICSNLTLQSNCNCRGAEVAVTVLWWESNPLIMGCLGLKLALRLLGAAGNAATHWRRTGNEAW